MDERVVQFRVGVVVLATAIIAAILIVLFGKLPALIRGQYTIYVKFQDAPGVAQDTPVRKSGILIGRVTKTELKDDGVLITLSVNSDVALKQKEAIRVSAGLLGDTVLQVVPSNDKSLPDTPVGSGDYLAGQVSPDLLQVVNNLQDRMGATITSLGGAGDEVANVARNLNRLMSSNDQSINRIVAKTEQSLDTFQRAMAGIDDLVGDEKTKADLKRALADLPELMKDTRKSVQSVQDAINSAGNVFKNIEGLTKPLGERGADIVRNMDRGVAHLDELLGQMAMFSKNLNTGEGTLNQLLNNPELYQQLNAAARNVNDLTRELKPIIRDARVVADTLARHPGALIRDAVSPQSGIKGPSPRGSWELNDHGMFDGRAP